jgi:hypothetical protein
MRASGTDKGDVSTLVEGSHFEGAARARRILLKNESDILALETLHLNTSIFSCFQVCCKLQYEGNFLGG